MKRPRTVTGRVALRLRAAVIGAAHELERVHPDLESIFMLVCAQATFQGLDPSDFDNDHGADAFRAIFTALDEREPEVIYVTPEWRRVVVTTRRYRAKPEQFSTRRWQRNDVGEYLRRAS